MSCFRDLRQREVFFDGAGLNRLHAPLSCGDVFEVETNPAKHYLFLAQPCDLMVRKDGERNAEVGLMVLISESAPRTRVPLPDYRFYELKGIFGSDRKWQVDFRKLFVVNLLVLDLAVLSPDGRAELRRDQHNPSIELTEGWSRRLKRLKCLIFPSKGPPVIPSLGMGKHTRGINGRLEGDWLRYPLHRIGRLEPNLATAILGAWATFQTRAALEHDFARIQSDHSGAGEQKPTE